MQADDMRDTILRLEDEIWAANRRGDGSYYQRYLTDDATAIATFGVFDKAAIVEQVAQNVVPYTSTRLSGQQVMLLGEDSALITYRADIEALQEGKPFSFSVYATSVWRRDRDGWRVRLHQQTPIQQP
jgi:uncharacterized protein (TIGR02246 family)